MDRSLWALQLTSLLGLAAVLLLGHRLGALAITIQLATVVLLVATLMLTFYHQHRQMKAELLRDSFAMYWRTYEPVSEEQLQGVMRFSDDYFDRRRFVEEYADDPERIRRYLHMSKLYEYFAYSKKVHSLRLEDPFGPDWLDRWTRDLVTVPEFLHVHEYYKPYYPEYAAIVDRELDALKGGVRG